ncbi:uncharacterized protein Dwil_GK13832 [Drosophila willistoni]|uniref:Exosome complex component 10 homolog n=1 Tax=Drosophila willistoni TaxID=7260 RepID=B4NJ59_DROWI|nr:exosome component 10 [Drosophila willistoni]EDW83852.1 uncharacterized protein Dwil_GK13832 [Drosophila willistoni]
MPRPQKRKNVESTEEEQTQQDQEIYNEEKEHQPVEDITSVGNLSDFTTQAFRNVVSATRCCNAFPQGTARSLYLSYPGYAKIIDDLSQRVVGLVGNVLQSQQIKGDINKRTMDEQFEMVQECNDIVFERITTNLDIKSGLRRNPQMMLETQVDVLNPQASASPTSGTESPSSTSWRAGSWNRSPATAPRGLVSARLFTAKNIMRPQLQFKELIDNNAQNPFLPRLREKPNSLKPLALLPEYNEAGNIQSYLHPYEFELLKFEPPQGQMQTQSPELPASMGNTELMLVDNLEKLQQAVKELSEASQIAIDVEHHSYRTFMGITCLVQMSTCSKDYIFDTLVLREDMQLLNLVMTDPKKLKILHGADLDIEWLQRDLSLYIVNMFDTHRAAKALNMARLSLAFLLKHYVDLDVDKSLQLADWRMRPLPQELINYARQDTHYLIYVYQCLTNDLLKLDNGHQQILRSVYQMSTEVCRKRYTKPHIGPDSHLDLVRKTKQIFDNRQLHALRGLFEWRDTTARQEDESYGYVMPNHMMLQIAESLPREMQGILACCNPIPPLVRQQLHTLHQIVLKAREQPLVKPILEAGTVTQRPLPVSSKDFNSKLYRPHDFSHLDETRDDLPTLLRRTANGKLKLPGTNIDKQVSSLGVPAMSLFGKPTVPIAEEELRWVSIRNESRELRMPYKRYLAILPFTAQLRKEQDAKEQSELLKRRLCPADPTPEHIQMVESAIKTTESANDHSMSLKEQLKRKHQSKTVLEDQPSSSKRLKLDENTKPLSAAPPIKSETSIINVDDGESDNSDVVEMPIIKNPLEPPSPATPTLSKRQQKRQRNNQQFKAKARIQQHSQSSNQPVILPKKGAPNFNYKNVDFKQFKGGAKRARGTEIKADIRGKNRPNNRNNKQFNKLFTFSNVKRGK